MKHKNTEHSNGMRGACVVRCVWSVPSDSPPRGYIAIHTVYLSHVSSFTSRLRALVA